MQSLTRPNVSTTAYSYNTINQLTEIANRTGAGAIIDRYAYTHDSRDMIANETVETAQALSALAESLQTYNYNQVNQLLSKTAVLVRFRETDVGEASEPVRRSSLASPTL